MTDVTIKKASAELKMKLRAKYGDDSELILFGSAAIGKYGDESDIDILVLLPFDFNNSLEEEIFGEAFDVELKYGVVFGIIVYSMEFWNSALASSMPLHKNIQAHGVAL